ncbi:T9SS type A sorting domain-containing protein [Cytophagaceae bacterium DM2B3-1]|uniref:T9SS type A sorting domain-containing protein n=1 Tax=Xanthocytophaga flava TaxID=3048013 RepID=A0ABT7CZM4_9BACT|nr:T9SS type A sorting domain-containing protein [Xanthocytophaga flavus]MDJ1498951.1 T9SS type A sorting domain-containing protein [Xanthocytophaga flavus]
MRRFQFIISLLFFYLALCHVWAQKESTIWYFGNHAGLDFSNGAPRVITNNAMNTTGGSAVMCDAQSGALLFYTNGYRIWNREHQPMKNADTTYPLDCPNGKSQAAMITPVPGSPERYYVFSLHPPPGTIIDESYCSSGAGSQQANVLKYCVIDMAGDQGKGEVILPNKVLDAGLTEKMTAVRHANGSDYWLVTHQWQSNQFRSYLVSTQGVSEAVVTAIGSQHGSESFSFELSGQLKASPNGKKIAVSLPSFEAFTYPLELFDFDSQTGILSNLINLGDIIFQYGLSFSPDNSKLYAQSLSPWVKRPYELIVQYDLQAGDSSAIIASRMSIITGNPYTNIRDIAVQPYVAMQLAPDGKLYGIFSVTGEPDSRRMVVIANPNAKGFDCEVNAVSFNFPIKGYWAGLPNFMDGYFNNLTPQNPPEGNCATSNLVVSPNPTTGEISLLLDECNDPYQLRIYDMTGRLISTQAVSGGGLTNVRLDDFAKGLYILDLLFEEGKHRKTVKVVKQ